MRYENRPRELRDLISRFEARSSADHCYTAIAALQSLREDGRDYWEPESEALKRWRRGCDDLLEFLNTLEARRKEPLAKVMREFVQEFEHSVERMYRLLFARSVPDGETTREQYRSWVECAYRLSTYAILSSWIEDKAEEATICRKIDLKTGEVIERGSCHKPMAVPKKYRKATKAL